MKKLGSVSDLYLAVFIASIVASLLLPLSCAAYFSIEKVPSTVVYFLAVLDFILHFIVFVLVSVLMSTMS